MDNTNGSSSSDVEMENGHTTNGCYKNGNSTLNDSIDGDEEMGIFFKGSQYIYKKVLIIICIILDVDTSPGCNTNKNSSKSGVERMLEFGRELFQMSQRLEKENGVNETNQKMLEVILF